MTHWHEKAAQLNDLLKLQTFPLGVKIMRRECDRIEKSKTSTIDEPKPLCQYVTMARHLGWTITVNPNDINCFFPLIAFGWKKVKLKADLINFFNKARYCINENVSQIRAEDFLRDRQVMGQGIIYSPLSKINFDPDAVLIYGNPAQLMRLIRGYVNLTGVPFQSSFLGGLSCAESLISCLQKNEPQVIIPGNGERVFAMTQDHEVAFCLPSKELGPLIAGLLNEHEVGTSRYPIPKYQFFSPKYPKIYEEFIKNSLT